MKKYLVGTVSDIPPGNKKIVNAGGKSIGIYNLNGEFYAIRNVCPHQNAGLCEGITTSYITSSYPGEFHFEREGEIVRCPWHFWEFDIKTGEMVLDPKTRTKIYDVSVEKFNVEVEKMNVFILV